MSRGDQADYLHLLCHAWLSEEPGTLPSPIETAARVVGWKPSELRSFFARFPTCFERKTRRGLDAFWNEFLSAQWDKYRDISEKRSRAASKSTAIASHAGGSAFAVASAFAVKDIKPGLGFVPATSTHNRKIAEASRESQVGTGPSDVQNLGGFKLTPCPNCGVRFTTSALKNHASKCGGSNEKS
jgi:hypothetical protein